MALAKHCVGVSQSISEGCPDCKCVQSFSTWRRGYMNRFCTSLDVTGWPVVGEARTVVIAVPVWLGPEKLFAPAVSPFDVYFAAHSGCSQHQSSRWVRQKYCLRAVVLIKMLWYRPAILLLASWVQHCVVVRVLVGKAHPPAACQQPGH